jgi:hypothetical protein
MMLGKRYHSRASYILNKASIEVPKHLYSVKGAARLFSRFESVNVLGLSALVDSIPERLPQAVFDWYLIFEHMLIGMLTPDLNYFLIVFGRKPVQIQSVPGWERVSLA